MNDATMTPESTTQPQETPETTTPAKSAGEAEAPEAPSAGQVLEMLAKNKELEEIRRDIARDRVEIELIQAGMQDDAADLAEVLNGLDPDNARQATRAIVDIIRREVARQSGGSKQATPKPATPANAAGSKADPFLDGFGNVPHTPAQKRTSTAQTDEDAFLVGFSKGIGGNLKLSDAKGEESFGSKFEKALMGDARYSKK